MSQRDAGYAIFAVTADQGIHAWAADLSGVFRQAALALWSLMLEQADVRRLREIPVSIEAPDIESLLVAWLNELLYISEVERLAAADCAIESLTLTSVTARVWGEKMDPRRHVMLGHVKAATYHQLQLLKSPRGWEARVIVDV